MKINIKQSTADKTFKFDASYYFSMAHWAEENNYLKPWERNFLYNIGRRIASGKYITEKQKPHVERLFKLADKSTYNPIMGI